ncbi:hypothetical protein AT302_13250 [Pandoraea norimbergensis]|uniref:Uncharacterized protein n=1 Tax=Pandoraea norimbergensis TaxID=93219 RepID=A0ABN4JHZ8_9BURK|nr:hypothetical protein AT302_13250 [Pandoraea norimbergensis]
MTSHASAISLSHTSADKLSTLSERIFALAVCTTDSGKEIPARFLIAMFGELGELATELVGECRKLRANAPAS